MMLQPSTICTGEDDGDRDDRTDANGGVALLLRHDGVPSASVRRWQSQCRSAKRRSYVARGLCSRVFLFDDDDDENRNEEGRVCVKRVMEDEQHAPHSVVREVICYKTIQQSSQGCTADCAFIMPLLAAFRDSSDEFDVSIDLIMPYHPCTLQDLLNEPSIQVGGTHEQRTDNDAGERVSRSIAYSLATSIDSFVVRTLTSLFSALDFLHAKGIAHRDVKPTNILISNVDHSILLIDFGTCSLPSTLYPPGDDGKGGQASEVGTGAYRAPECLLSPRNGYDPFKVDIWQAGATMVEFFLSLRKLAVRAKRGGEEDSDKLDWERALWNKEEGGAQAWSALRDRFDQIDGHTPSFYGQQNADEVDDEEENDFDARDSVTGWSRSTLFDGTRGDLGLANSIFSLCGLPRADEEGQKMWPEASEFQPPLALLPFARRPPAEGGLRSRLTSASVESKDLDIQKSIDVLDACLQRSASQRITAYGALERLQG